MRYDLKPLYVLAEAKLNVVGDLSLEHALDSFTYCKKNWPLERKVVAYIQFLLNTESDSGLIVDGWYGPNTDNALDAYFNGKQDWRTDLPDYDHIDEVYGNINIVHKKIIQITPAYDHYLAWAPKTKVSKISCHERIADAYQSILMETVKAYGKDRIKELRLDQFGGSYVQPPRTMRGGSKFSTHCWGIAFDYDPVNNQLKWGKDKAAFARHDYEDWRAIWKEHGAISLGVEKNYDWMHWQFSKL